jgi:YD repeat-containing protein
MVTNWAFEPVCGFDYWRTIVTSPEVMIFLFFMITDPKTVPAGRVGRVVFGFLVAVASTFLMAPQTNEYGTKVGLLAGLVVLCAARPILDRLLPEPRSAADEIGRFATRLVLGGESGTSVLRGAVRTAVALAAVLVLGVGVVAAGTPARGLVVPDTTEMLRGVPHEVDPTTFPAITVGQDVIDLDHKLAGPGAQQLLLTIAQNLELENQALLRRDATILTAVDHGDRLIEMQGRLQDAITSGTATIAHYRFDEVAMSVLRPFGKQSGLTIGLASRGTVTEQTYDASGNLTSSTTAKFEQTFVTRRETGSRWLNVAVLPFGSTG